MKRCLSAGGLASQRFEGVMHWPELVSEQRRRVVHVVDEQDSLDTIGVEGLDDPFLVSHQPISSTNMFILPARTRPTSSSKCNRSEEHTSELQSLMRISYAVFCLKNKNNINK